MRQIWVFFKYNLHFEVKLNLASIGGLVFAFWIYKKIR
ncbi:DUF4321 domain-containing protein [Brevibacillus laterosporus]